MRLAERTTRSLLYPGQEIQPGEAYCLSCPWAAVGVDVQAQALRHFNMHHHPTAWRNPGSAKIPG